jgi:NTE family protein
MTVAPFLRQVPLLDGVPSPLLERLSTQVRELSVPAGDWLLREGEGADSAFVVKSGRLEVLREGPPESLINVLRRGEVFGELALLADGVRSASVRARRDSDVLELDRRDFEALIREAPTFAVGLTRTLGAQLAAGRPQRVSAPRPRTFAVVALDDGAPAAAVADLLVRALERYGAVGRLVADDHVGGEAMRMALDRAESASDRVVLAGTAEPGDEWTAFCLREADLVIAVSRGEARPDWLARPAALRGCELLVAGSPLADATVWGLAPREVQVLTGEAELRRAVEVLARRSAGRAVGIVLSGGGARAFAHIGVLEVLQDAGVTCDRLGGVSLGALVAAAFASGFGHDEIYRRFHRNFVRTNPSNDFTWPAYSLVRGAKTRRLLRAEFGEARIEGLPTRFFCVSSDLLARESVVHDRGLVWETVYASMALPGVFPPVRTEDGRLLVDGGVLDNLPVATMSRLAEGPVIAVDVTGRLRQAGRPSRPGITRLGRPVRRFLTGSETQVPRLGETVMRTVTAGSVDTVAAARAHADVVISPAVDRIGLMDFRRLSDVRDAGRRAAADALARMPAEIFG